MVATLHLKLCEIVYIHTYNLQNRVKALLPDLTNNIIPDE